MKILAVVDALPEFVEGVTKPQRYVLPVGYVSSNMRIAQEYQDFAVYGGAIDQNPEFIAAHGSKVYDEQLRSKLFPSYAGVQIKANWFRR